MKAEDFTLDQWSKKEYGRLLKYLRAEAEDEYRQFHSRLIPDCGEMLGVRMPKLRALGKRIVQGNWREYLNVCQNGIFEERVLRGIVIGLAPVNFDELRALADGYIPLINNWALCDYFCSGLKRVKKFEKEFLPNVREYLASDSPWYRRAGLVFLRGYYVKKEYLDDIFSWAEQTVCEHYYVQMAHAWLIAECYTKFPEETYAYLTGCCLNQEILNKAVQKIRDSYRVDEIWKERALVFRRKK